MDKNLNKNEKSPKWQDAEIIETKQNFPLISLPNQVLFPGAMIPISSLGGFKNSDLQLIKSGKLKFGLLTDLGEQKTSNIKVLSSYGTEAIVTALFKLPNGEIGAMIKGQRRLVAHRVYKKNYGLIGSVAFLRDRSSMKKDQKVAEVDAFKNLVVEFLKLNQNISQEIVTEILSAADVTQIGFLISPIINMKIKSRLKILSNFKFNERIKDLICILGKEVELLKLSNKIQKKVKDGVRDSVRKNYLREQMHLIKKELFELGSSEGNEIYILRQRFEDTQLSKEAEEVVIRELDKLEMMHHGSPEYMTSWTYLNLVLDLPWGKKKKENDVFTNIQLKEASNILNDHHFGLEKIKERILEFFALLKYKGRLSGQILILTGPPGVGKTSLGKSIAKALGRQFERISLGGVRDESEIRGHRRTYIGSMPGKIIQAVKNSKSLSPVIMLDEIDKAGKEGIYDITSALLEVLDPEQNKTFVDHYLGFPFDLSKVLFIATANSLRELSLPLLDRMEVVELSGYTENEKLAIAENYLVPKISKNFSLSPSLINIEQSVLKLIIRHYTRESGVRQLQRCLEQIYRKVVKSIVESGDDAPNFISSGSLATFLGMPKYQLEPNEKKLPFGVALGLAFTTLGGEVLYIESRKIDSKASGSNLMLTGSLGQIMQESAQTVYSFLLSNCELLGLDGKSLLDSKVHIHLPDGATPKDGPSAGVALLCALTSLFKGISLRSSLAMTGEITLRGMVLPVGGIKEKITAAHRYGKKEVIIPASNWNDLEDIPEDVLTDLNIYPVSSMVEVLEIAHLTKPLKGTLPKAKKFNKENMFKQLHWESNYQVIDGEGSRC